MSKVRYVILLVVISILNSCSFSNHSLEDVLKRSGSNRKELEAVLFHFQNDSLKYKAARFLIENMEYHVFQDGSELKKYLKYYECIAGRGNEVQRIVDSLKVADGKFAFEKLKENDDLHVIKASYLISNIDLAFKVWKEQPWGKNIDFHQFCEYILPYRVGDEVPTDWRKQVYEKYNPLLDAIRNLPEAEDPLFVARVLMDSLRKQDPPLTYTGILSNGPHVGPGIIKWRIGSCRELADVATYVLRSVGIPCVIDYAVRGDNNGIHYWNVVQSKSGRQYMIELPEMLFKPVEEYNIPKGKVFRRTFDLNEKDLDRMNTYSMFIHPYFRVPLFIDVTSLYSAQRIQDLKFPKTFLYENVASKHIVYLCISRRQDWVPIAWTLQENDSLSFCNVERDIVCRLATWNGFRLNLCSDPFLIENETTKIRVFNPRGGIEKIIIYYKFPLFNENYRRRLISGVFEGSNDESFLTKDTLFLIKQAPERLFTTIYIKSVNRKYRYVRYKGSKNSFCNVAEIEFYNQEKSTIPLTGRVIGTSGCWQNDGSHEYTNAFDGNPYTSFDYNKPSSGWTGLDLSTPHHIEKIRYAPRNRDNFIRKGDDYELLYWEDRKWNSTGIKKAFSDSLVYDIPKGTLLYLKDNTRGKDERIFEYKDQKIKFW